MSENNIEDLIKGIKKHAGVKGFIIVNYEGIPIRHDFDDNDRQLAIHYAGLLQNLATKAASAIEKLEPSGNGYGGAMGQAAPGALSELQFIRLRSRKHEILVAPEQDYLLIVIQEPVLH